MDATLEQLLSLKVPENITIAGCISTTAISHVLRKELDQEVINIGQVYNFSVQLQFGLSASGKRLKVLDQLPTSVTGLQDMDFVTGVLRIIRDRYKYDHVVLHTWDHGSGYAIFPSPDQPEPGPPPTGLVVRKKKASGVLRNPDHHSPVHRLFRKANLVAGAKDLRTNRKLSKFRAMLNDLRWAGPAWGLTMDNLRQAILTTFGKVDVIFMRNCYMQVFDTGFVLRDVADYLVATEGIMWFPTYDYAKWLHAMEKAEASPNNGMSAAEGMAAAAVKGLTKASVDPWLSMDTAMFGNDLSYYPAINNAMNTMIGELIRYAPGNKKKLLEIRHGIKDFVARDNPGAGFQLVDAGLWFGRAAKLMGHSEKYKKALEDFLVLRDRSVGGRCKIGKLLENHGYHASGISLYFPASRKDIGQYMSYYQLYYAVHSVFRSDIVNSSLWDEFIGYLFLNLTPRLLQ